MDGAYTQQALHDDYHAIKQEFNRVYPLSPTPIFTLTEIQKNMQALYNTLTQQPSKPIKEFDLFNVLIQPSQGWSASSQLALFEKHFITRFTLYFFAQHSQLWLIDIQLTAINVTPAKNVSHKHTQPNTTLGNNNLLQAFYYDWIQLNTATTDTVNTLLKSFWQRFSNTNQIQHDLDTLGIHTPLQHIKKQDIKRAFKRQAQHSHPDKGGDAEHFNGIQQAYERLLKVYLNE